MGGQVPCFMSHIKEMTKDMGGAGFELLTTHWEGRGESRVADCGLGYCLVAVRTKP